MSKTMRVKRFVTTITPGHLYFQSTNKKVLDVMIKTMKSEGFCVTEKETLKQPNDRKLLHTCLMEKV